ncbi:hypothetical protein [Anaplasma phagocytophilum]|uniref:hypothetical protein n=1 Tax=Anaplasma phagocytophilum TaxID=948 RepID=UPI0031FA0E69
MHVLEATKASAEVATVPASSVFKRLFLHQLTDKGMYICKTKEVTRKQIKYF